MLEKQKTTLNPSISLKSTRETETKGYSKNIQIGINTVNQSIKMIEKLGIEVRVDTSETDDQVKMIISFPKK